MAGDYKRFLERTAKIQAGPADLRLLLELRPGAVVSRSRKQGESPGANFRLLFFFILMVQLSDALALSLEPTGRPACDRAGDQPQQNLGRLFGRRGQRDASGRRPVVGDAFRAVGRRRHSLLISVMGFAGGMTMSAIKRDRGVKDYGTLVEGHGGVLDRIDSLCFAAPVVFHVTRFFFPLQQP